MKEIFKGMDNGPQAINDNFNELTSSSRSMEVKDLKATGSLTSMRQYKATAEAWQGFTISFYRVNNTINIVATGNANVKIDGWAPFGANVPLGYRPEHETQALIYVGNQPGFITVGADGSMYNGGVWNTMNSDYDKQVRIIGSWSTLDALPE
ncbi:unnamed protein product [Fructobacillus evanidus]|uniref:Uncharacterized protein n=1 Tax=Fructobacillus evanidus TaxID=3064281 RepID=A0ABN9Z3F6_9LACO|nr:MAG: hypothetical protein [Caudoviricetes sp.]CAK1223840.1 unnamed protein product [Fructobacillus sp. LMG 32999]CAK1248408.1 unnamed protein product [Fructobacillus sp. LMG 32999]CAK1249223.1 unnamed protein product [Fructobacillus sp. LMG 32999]CAK1254346.1 unnamed protein product [Fructobacillus sp. LMG 32999]